MRVIKYILTQAMFFGLLIMGTVYEVEGAANVIKALVWIGFVLALFLLSDECRRRILADEKPPIAPQWVGNLQVMVAVGTMIWFGWIATGIAYLLYAGLHGVARDAQAKERAAAQAVKA